MAILIEYTVKQRVRARTISAILETLDHVHINKQVFLHCCPPVSAVYCSHLAIIVDLAHLAKSVICLICYMLTMFKRVDIFYIPVKLTMTLSPVVVSTSVRKNNIRCIKKMTSVAKHV